MVQGQYFFAYFNNKGSTGVERALSKATPEIDNTWLISF